MAYKQVLEIVPVVIDGKTVNVETRIEGGHSETYHDGKLVAASDVAHPFHSEEAKKAKGKKEEGDDELKDGE